MARDTVNQAQGSQRFILDEQIQAKGLHAGDYALFFVSREGILWPTGTE